MSPSHSPRPTIQARALAGPLLAIFLLPLLAATPALSEEVTVPIDDPSRPVELDVGLTMASITVEAWDGEAVQIRYGASDSSPEADRPQREDGLRRIASSGMQLDIEASGNRVEVSSHAHQQEMDVVIRVPARCDLKARTLGGAISVRGVRGELELKSANGAITGDGLAGSVVASASNGGITVELVDVEPDKPMSFISWNGDIDVTVPAGISADLRMSTMNGDTLTDFDVELMPNEATVEKDEEGFRYSVDREVRARVGGGGPELRLQTYNGDVKLRRGN